MPKEETCEKQDFFQTTLGLSSLLLDFPVASSCTALGNLGFVHFFQRQRAAIFVANKNSLKYFPLFKLQMLIVKKKCIEQYIGV